MSDVSIKVPVFIGKLFVMLSEATYSDIVRWDDVSMSILGTADKLS